MEEESKLFKYEKLPTYEELTIEEKRIVDVLVDVPTYNFTSSEQLMGYLNSIKREKI